MLDIQILLHGTLQMSVMKTMTRLFMFSIEVQWVPLCWFLGSILLSQLVVSTKGNRSFQEQKNDELVLDSLQLVGMQLKLEAKTIDLQFSGD